MENSFCKAVENGNKKNPKNSKQSAEPKYDPRSAVAGKNIVSPKNKPYAGLHVLQ